MALCKIENLKINATAFLAFISFYSVAVLFSFGAIYYINEHTKVLNYANGTCNITKITFQTYKCLQLYFRFPCHVASWHVRYINRTVTMEGTKRHRSSESALREANKYKVSKY